MRDRRTRQCWATQNTRKHFCDFPEIWDQENLFQVDKRTCISHLEGVTYNIRECKQLSGMCQKIHEVIDTSISFHKKLGVRQAYIYKLVFLNKLCFKKKAMLIRGRPTYLSGKISTFSRQKTRFQNNVSVI